LLRKCSGDVLNPDRTFDSITVVRDRGRNVPYLHLSPELKNRSGGRIRAGSVYRCPGDKRVVLRCGCGGHARTGHPGGQKEKGCYRNEPVLSCRVAEAAGRALHHSRRRRWKVRPKHLQPQDMPSIPLHQTACSVLSLIPATSARFVHDPLAPWERPEREALRGRYVLWHTLWSETYSNPRYAELVPRLDALFFAPIRERAGRLGRVDGALTRNLRFIERRALEWYRHHGIEVLLTPAPAQARSFPGPVVVDLDDPTFSPDEQAALNTRSLRHVVTTTEETAQYVRATNPTVGTTVLPQGVDIEKAASANHGDVRRKLLEKLRLPSDTVIVGYHAPVIRVSTDDRHQVEGLGAFDIDVLLSAARELWTQGLSFVVVLVGKASPTVRQLAGEEKRVVLAGYVDRDRLFDWLGAFDVGAYPRMVDRRGFQSVKLLEYMASGAAIVAMRMTETQFLDEEGTAYTAETPEEFGGLLRRLIEYREERLKLVARAHVAVKAHDWKTLAASYNRVLAAVVETG
jgi:glycosyltransferase involved in cell wall biosynthesis